MSPFLVVVLELNLKGTTEVNSTANRQLYNLTTSDSISQQLLTKTTAIQTQADLISTHLLTPAN